MIGSCWTGGIGAGSVGRFSTRVENWPGATCCRTALMIGEWEDFPRAWKIDLGESSYPSGHLPEGIDRWTAGTNLSQPGEAASAGVWVLDGWYIALSVRDIDCMATRRSAGPGVTGPACPVRVHHPASARHSSGSWSSASSSRTSSSPNERSSSATSVVAASSSSNSVAAPTLRLAIA